jgi:dipeptidyl aminopeptidase/acylaminoacyl peptidase
MMQKTALAIVFACGLAASVRSADDAIAPGDNLTVQGIPRVTTQLAEDVGRYSEFRRAAFEDWHPTRRAMLISTRFGDTAQVHEVRMPGGARRQLTFYPDHVRSGIAYQPGTGDAFLFLKDKGGDEFFQLYRQDFKTGAVTRLTDGASRNTTSLPSTRGDRIVWSSTKRDGKDTDLWIANVSDPGSARQLCELSGGGWQASAWSPDDKKILLGEGISANESYLWVVDATSGEKTLLTPKGGGEKVAYGDGKFSADGKGLYVTTDKDSEFRRLAYVDLATGKHTYLSSAIQWDVDELDVSRDGQRVAFATNEDGVSVLRLLDTKTGKEIPAPKIPVGVLSGLKWHSNGRDLGFTLESAHSSADAYSVDVTAGKLERWTLSETGGLATDGFAEPQLVRWPSFDGRQISGFLYMPSARFTGKRPVVIAIHGGPEAQYRPGFLGSANYFIDQLGIARIYPNVRGSTGYGKTFLQLDNGMKREDTYKDIAELLDWIKTRPDLDAERVMVTGGSYGGHMTLAVATNYDDRIRCSLDVVGISNLATFLEHTSGYRQDLRRVEYGDERDPKMREFLERIAPLNNAAKIHKPLFVVQGKNDPRVPLSESEQMIATVRKNGTPVWYLMASDEGHGFGKKKNTDFQLYATVLFVREYLLN